VAVTTAYSVPDDGRKGRPKHVELLTPNKEHKEKLRLVGIYMISTIICEMFFFQLKAKNSVSISIHCEHIF